MTPIEFKTYFEHNIGLSLLGIWCYQNKAVVSKKENTIFIPITKANLFNLGFSTKPKDKYLFFACQRDEINWMKRIKWSRLIVDKFNQRLVLISKRIEGDKVKLPDIPEVAVAIPYETEQRIAILENQNRIALKEFAFEDGEVLTGSNSLFVIPIVVKAKEDRYFNRNEMMKYTTHNDLLVGNITRTNVFKAQYKGEIVDHFSDSKLNRLMRDFNASDYEGEIETGTFVPTPAAFNQFKKEKYDYNASWIEQRNQNNKKVLGREEDLDQINEEILKKWY